jgi:SAM-dependent methyltransferase
MKDFVSPISKQPLTTKGNFLVSQSGEKYPIINDIPRFVSSDNYAKPFGMQWNRFQKTQLDSYTGKDYSKKRLEDTLREQLSNLKEKDVLEAGCGAGRFTEIVLRYGANAHSFDISEAVEANRENIGDRPNYSISQADIMHIPYQESVFDYVICLGVLQHTPYTEASICSLYKMLKPGGKLVIDHYIRQRGMFTSMYLLYWFVIKRLNPEVQFSVTDRLVKFFFPIHWRYKDNNFIQMLLRRVSPINFYYPKFELTKELHYEWSLLDTHDRNTDYYKRHLTPAQIRRILESIGAVEIWVQGGKANCIRPK